MSRGDELVAVYAPRGGFGRNSVRCCVLVLSRNDLVVTTIDLGRNVALEMASGGLVKGVAAQRVYDQGVTEALLAGYGLLGKPAPAYVALPALPVTKADVADAWQIVYRRPNPDLQQGVPA